MPAEFDLRGSLTLEEITRALMHKERTGFVRVTKLAAKTIAGRPPRTAVFFNDDDSDDLPPDLHLIAVHDGDNLPSIVAAQLALGHTLLTTAGQPFSVFVNDQPAKVLVFRG